jgi:hypothetical protein
MNVRLYHPDRALRLLISYSVELSLQAVLEALFHNGRVAFHVFLLVECKMRTGSFQAASVTADLFLEDVVQECIRVREGLVAAVAGECGLIIFGKRISSNV